MDAVSFSRRAVLGLAAVAGGSLLAGCKVVSIEAEKQAAAAGAFNAKAWAEQLWAPKVLPYFASSAKPLPDVLAAVAGDLDAAGKQFGYRPAAVGSAWSFAVTGQGTVVKKHTESRAGTLEVTVDGAAPDKPVIVQIGPVIIGSTIRDALPFVDFKDFTNQLEFADAGKALTALALAGITPVLESIKEGSKISFSGAFPMTSKTDPVKIMPVTLKVLP